MLEKASLVNDSFNRRLTDNNLKQGQTNAVTYQNDKNWLCEIWTHDLRQPFLKPWLSIQKL